MDLLERLQGQSTTFGLFLTLVKVMTLFLFDLKFEV